MGTIVAAESVLDRLKENDPDSYRMVDRRQPLPAVYRGGGPIRLIVLGQDPTIHNPEHVGMITVVLNLMGHGPLWGYVKGICLALGLEIEKDLYATNLFKNFFVAPPTKLAKTEPDLLKRFTELWLDLLNDELAEFPDAPVITLGDPVLRSLAMAEASPFVRDYWGYTPDWKLHEPGTFSFLPKESNRLGRRVFPFPHAVVARTQPFYSSRMQAYLRYFAEETGLDAAGPGGSNE